MQEPTEVHPFQLIGEKWEMTQLRSHEGRARLDPRAFGFLSRAVSDIERIIKEALN